MWVVLEDSLGFVQGVRRRRDVNCDDLKRRLDAESDPVYLNALQFQYEANCVKVTFSFSQLCVQLSNSFGFLFELFFGA